MLKSPSIRPSNNIAETFYSNTHLTKYSHKAHTSPRATRRQRPTMIINMTMVAVTGLGEFNVSCVVQVYVTSNL